MSTKPRDRRLPRSFAAAALPLAVMLLAALSFGSIPSQPQVPAPSAAKAEPSLDAKVDALFAPWKGLDSPGAAVAVVKDGLVVYRKGFGSAQLEYGIPITPSTVFHVASVSKQFTAMAITMLEAEGKLSADDDIRKYLPETADFGAPVTIRHLLNHTGGLRDQWELAIMSGKRMDDVLTQDFLLDRIRRQRELNFAPGARFLYSNSGYTLLAEIVSRVSGRPFTDWTRDRIFAPLGMTSTRFHLDHTEIVRDRAYSYDGDRGEGFRNAPLNYANVGATSLFTTVEDMANWIRNYEDKKVGGPAVWDMMLTRGKLSDGTEIDYARGIMHGVYQGLKTIGHSGGDAGFASHVVYFPGQRFGVAVFSNLASFDPGAMAMRIADIYLASQLAAASMAQAGESQAPVAAAQAPGPITLSPEELAAFAGTYWLESDLVRKLVVDKDKLVYVRSSDNRSDLAPVSPTRFRMLGVPGEVFLDFTGKADGLYNAFTFTESNGQKIGAKRIEPFEPTAAQLEEYAGTYYSRELDVRYVVTARAGSLRIKPGLGEEVEAGPLKKDSFAASRFRIEFARDGKGRVSGLRISTGRVLNLKFTRERDRT